MHYLGEGLACEVMPTVVDVWASTSYQQLLLQMVTLSVPNCNGENLYIDQQNAICIDINIYYTFLKDVPSVVLMESAVVDKVLKERKGISLQLTD